MAVVLAYCAGATVTLLVCFLGAMKADARRHRREHSGGYDSEV